MTLVVVDTSVWQRRGQPGVGASLGDALEADAVAMVEPIELELLRSAWNGEDHCDRHFELVGEVTGQPMRRLGT